MYEPRKDNTEARIASYKAAREKTEKLLRVLDSAINGTSLSKACAEEKHVQKKMYRHYGCAVMWKKT